MAYRVIPQRGSIWMPSVDSGLWQIVHPPNDNPPAQLQYRSTLDPISAPSAAMNAAPIEYQVATKRGESSVQCEA